MKAIQIEIPREIVLALKMPSESAKKQLSEELAIHLYRYGFFSFGKARQLAGLIIFAKRVSMCCFMNEMTGWEDRLKGQVPLTHSEKQDAKASSNRH